MSLLNLFKLNYWFAQPFPALGWIKWTWVLLFLSFVILSVVFIFLRQYKSKDKFIKKVYTKSANLFLSVGLLGLLWMFFRQEKVPFLSWRFWLLLLVLILGFGLYRILHYFFKRLPQIKEEKIRQENIKKYIP